MYLFNGGALLGSSDKKLISTGMWMLRSWLFPSVSAISSRDSRHARHSRASPRSCSLQGWGSFWPRHILMIWGPVVWMYVTLMSIFASLKHENTGCRQKINHKNILPEYFCKYFYCWYLSVNIPGLEAAGECIDTWILDIGSWHTAPRTPHQIDWKYQVHQYL